ncbi:MAG: lipopolysaccharide transport periplasmic protein LptA [Proteobacteria bacterium]|nr:lipopolysaccharide transport periplasmic protein LptA [Pseudomonadota bacterium]
MLKLSSSPNTKTKSMIHGLLLILMVFVSTCTLALESDKKADFVLDADHFKNLPVVKSGLTQIKFWDNVYLHQGTLKINADQAIVYNGKDGISEVVLTGSPVTMEQFIDVEFGKIDVRAKKIEYKIKDDMIFMTGDVFINSKVQGEMSGEKISMNLKTNEIKGVKSENKRVRLVIKSQSKDK